LFNTDAQNELAPMRSRSSSSTWKPRPPAEKCAPVRSFQGDTVVLIRYVCPKHYFAKIACVKKSYHRPGDARWIRPPV